MLVAEHFGKVPVVLLWTGMGMNRSDEMSGLRLQSLNEVLILGCKQDVSGVLRKRSCEGTVR